MNTLKIEEIGSDGLAIFQLGQWGLIVNFDFYIDESSWDSWRCEFSDIDVTIQSIEWGTPDGDVVPSNLSQRNKTRIAKIIRNHIDQNTENFGADTTGLDKGWEPTYQNTW